LAPSSVPSVGLASPGLGGQQHAPSGLGAVTPLSASLPSTSMLGSHGSNGTPGSSASNGTPTGGAAGTSASAGAGGSSSSTAGGSATTPQDKQSMLANEKRRRRRESHNAVERRRRDNINEKISELATLIPECMLEGGVGTGSGSGNGGGKFKQGYSIRVFDSILINFYRLLFAIDRFTWSIALVSRWSSGWCRPAITFVFDWYRSTEEGQE